MIAIGCINLNSWLRSVLYQNFVFVIAHGNFRTLVGCQAYLLKHIFIVSSVTSFSYEMFQRFVSIPILLSSNLRQKSGRVVAIVVLKEDLNAMTSDLPLKCLFVFLEVHQERYGNCKILHLI